MDLRTHYPYSLLRYGIPQTYPSLTKNIKTDVAIIGAGITGALAGWKLGQSGIDCVIVDKRHVATGSTAASTSLIQYEIDTPLYKLIKLIGYKKAVRSYELCREAIGGLKKVCIEVGNESNFTEKCSLQFASYKKDSAGLKKEFELRRSLGFPVDFLTEKQIEKEYHFSAPAALLSYEAAQVDAYLLTHHILKKLSQSNCPIYDHTDIVSIDNVKRSIKLLTRDNHTITAKHVIVACGYESGKYIHRKFEDLRCTYVIATEPLVQKEFWRGNCLIWETKDPYLYIRSTNDNRIIIGGKDSPYSGIERQIALLPQKTKALHSRFQKLFPHLPVKIDFQWAGTFASTKDGLPYIGSTKNSPNIHFALGYGGNGITFSLVASELIAQSVSGKKNRDAGLFSFDRTCNGINF